MVAATLNVVTALSTSEIVDVETEKSSEIVVEVRGCEEAAAAKSPAAKKAPLPPEVCSTVSALFQAAILLCPESSAAPSQVLPSVPIPFLLLLPPSAKTS